MTQPLRAVVAGCGGISNLYFQSAAEIDGLEIVGLADLRLDATRSMADKHGLPDARRATDLAALLDQVQPDLVFDCTVPEAHEAVTIAALERGCHVLGEKPMAHSMEAARRMVAAAERNGRTYAVMQNRRFDPNIRRTRELLASGAVGELTTANCDFYLAPHFGGFRDRMAHPLLIDMAIHTFDAARYLTAADPVDVFCHAWNPRGSWYAGAAAAVAVFRMTDQVVYTYRGSWCAEGLNTSWEADWRLIGSRGTIRWDGALDLRAEAAEHMEGFAADIRPVEPPGQPDDRLSGGHTGLIRDFVRCIREGRQPETVCTDNIRSLAMVYAAVESAETGRTVRIRS